MKKPGDLLFDGVASGETPPFGLCPLVAWEVLAAQFKLGQELKGEGAWNAAKENHPILENEEFLLNRIDHAIRHLLTYRQRYLARDISTDPKDDIIKDAGAIMFAGALLACAAVKLRERMEERKDKEPTKSETGAPSEEYGAGVDVDARLRSIHNPRKA